MYHILAEIKITPSGALLNGQPVEIDSTEADLLHDLYRRYVNDYPKFFKMDGLCKLGFIASELLLQSVDEERFADRNDRAVVLCNRSGSIEADRRYQATIADKDNFFPSPALFVYTLPNIVTGEIAIRNKYHGETSFFITDSDSPHNLQEMAEAAFADQGTSSILIGWVDFYDTQHFEANMKLIIKK